MFTLLLLLSISLQMQVDSLCNRAYDYEDLGDFQTAIRLNEEALSITPQDSLQWISDISSNATTDDPFALSLNRTQPPPTPQGAERLRGYRLEVSVTRKGGAVFVVQEIGYSTILIPHKRILHQKNAEFGKICTKKMQNLAKYAPNICIYQLLFVILHSKSKTT